jgi:peroxiredoxin Q/BCP
MDAGVRRNRAVFRIALEMNRLITPGEAAPDFELEDINGSQIRLSSFQGHKSIVLYLLRGFMRPYCRVSLARLRDDYSEFTVRGVEILAVGPGTNETFQRYWKNERMPFVGLPDPAHRVARMYRQEIKLFRLGRMPLMCLADKNGLVRCAHYGASMRDIPSVEELLHVINELKTASH